MRVVVLGCATSTGVPIVGCSCDVCRSQNPKNKRTRSSVFIEAKGKNILIDTSTDLRAQALANGVTRIDYVLYTHTHADHTHGIDDLRVFNFINKNSITCFGSPKTVESIKRNFAYIFDDSYPAGGKPRLDLVEVDAEFSFEGITVTPIRINHAHWTIYGFRIGDFAYLTDCSSIPPQSLEQLAGLEVLIIGALRYKPHPAHFSVEEALMAVKEINPRRAYLTHMGHELDYRKLTESLPEGVMPAYDGMTLELKDGV